MKFHAGAPAIVNATFGPRGSDETVPGDDERPSAASGRVASRSKGRLVDPSSPLAATWKLAGDGYAPRASAHTACRRRPRLAVKLFPRGEQDYKPTASRTVERHIRPLESRKGLPVVNGWMRSSPVPESQSLPGPAAPADHQPRGPGTAPPARPTLPLSRDGFRPAGRAPLIVPTRQESTGRPIRPPSSEREDRRRRGHDAGSYAPALALDDGPSTGACASRSAR